MFTSLSISEPKFRPHERTSQLMITPSFIRILDIVARAIEPQYI